MNYELAKELKDAGFPQEAPREPFCKECNLPAEYVRDFKHEKEYIRVPTLSELIEACPRQIDDGDFCLRSYSSGEWTAGYYRFEDWSILEDGPTPEEAVARLWLALNKHD